MSEWKRLEAANILANSPGEIHVHECRSCCRVYPCSSKLCRVHRNEGDPRTCAACMSPDEIRASLDDGAFD